MKVTVIGAGAWGTTIANLLAKKGHNVLLWVREKELFKDLIQTNENTLFLPNIILSSLISYTQTYSEAMAFSDTIILALPVRFYREMAQNIKPFLTDRQTFINISKGIEPKTFAVPSQILKEVFKNREYYLATLSGPNIASEIAQEKLAKAVIATEDKKMMNSLKDLFETDYFRIYCSNDIVGIELAGALKNVISIAAGICDGLELGNNTKSALLSRGLYEMTIIGKYLGAKVQSFYGLAGVGDLIVSSFSPQARNKKAGELIAQGKTFDQVIAFMNGKTIEGAYTLQSIYELAKESDLELPISTQMYEIIYKNKNPKQAFLDIWQSKSKEDVCQI